MLLNTKIVLIKKFMFLADIKKSVFKERLSSATSRAPGALPNKPPDLKNMRKGNSQSAKISKRFQTVYSFLCEYFFTLAWFAM